MHMLYRYVLLALAPFSRQGFDARTAWANTRSESIAGNRCRAASSMIPLRSEIT